MPNRIPNPGAQHPERWREDLNPDAMAGANVGTAGPHPEQDARTAYEIKSLNQRLQGYTDDELKQIPILPRGSRLEQGAAYIDLAQDQPEEFTATGDMEAGSDNCYVPKSAVDYTLWNRLIGVETPERLSTNH